MQVEVCKVCTTCGLSKSTDNYSRDNSKQGGYKRVCKYCDSARSAKWRSDNSFIKKEKDALYRAANKDKIQVSQKLYRTENREKRASFQREYYKENKFELLDYRAIWKKVNPDKVNAIGAKRRASQLSATPSWLTDKHHTQIADMYWLAKDLETISGESYHVDHIVPLQGKNVCGLHVPWNLQVLPATENIRKNNKYDDWKDYAYQ